MVYNSSDRVKSMNLLNYLIDTMGHNLIDASIAVEKERTRQELRQGSIDVEFKVLSTELTEKSK